MAWKFFVLFAVPQIFEQGTFLTGNNVRIGREERRSKSDAVLVSGTNFLPAAVRKDGPEGISEREQRKRGDDT